MGVLVHLHVLLIALVLKLANSVGEFLLLPRVLDSQARGVDVPYISLTCGRIALGAGGFRVRPQPLFDALLAEYVTASQGDDAVCSAAVQGFVANGAILDAVVLWGS